jgi:aminoacrylate hydrolase
MLDAAPEAYAALTFLLGYPPAHLETIWPTFDRAVAGAPRTAAARAVIRERIDALLAFDGRALARAIRRPVLVIGARDDMVVPRHLQIELAAALAGARHAELDDGGHFVPVTETERFCGLVEAWLDGAVR